MQNLYLYITVYILLILGISLWLARKSSNNEDFLIAGRNRKSFEIFSSKFANSVGISWFITYTGYTYLYGFSILSILPGIIISYLLFAYWAVPKIYKNSRKHQFYTQGDFIAFMTKNPFDKKIIDAISIVISTIWLLVSVIGGAKVISYLNILTYNEALLLTSFVILIYILLSGFKAVIVTDIVQSIIILLLFGFTIVSFLELNDWNTLVSTNTQSMSPVTVVAFFVYGLFSIFSFPDRYQLTFSARNHSEATKGMALSVIPIVVMILLLLSIGLIVRSHNASLDADLVFIKLFFDYLPETFISVGLLLFLSGLMSSADTNVFNITSYLAFFNNKEGNKVKEIRILTIILMVVVTLIAYFFRDIIGATIFAAGVSLVPSIAMIYIIAGGKNSQSFVSLILGGIVGLILGLSLIGLEPSVALLPIIGSGFGFGVFKILQKLS